MVKNNIENTVNPVVQFVSTNNTGLIRVSAVIPLDDTIPQKAEGTEIITLAITPKSATNILLIEFSSCTQISAGGVAVLVALFQDATDNALAATWGGGDEGNQIRTSMLRYIMIAGTTAATTFKIRAGPNVVQNIAFNGDPVGATRRFGGVGSTWLTITEFYV